jgi:hypothetical protein
MGQSYGTIICNYKTGIVEIYSILHAKVEINVFSFESALDYSGAVIKSGNCILDSGSRSYDRNFCSCKTGVLVSYLEERNVFLFESAPDYLGAVVKSGKCILDSRSRSYNRSFCSCKTGILESCSNL